MTYCRTGTRPLGIEMENSRGVGSTAHSNLQQEVLNSPSVFYISIPGRRVPITKVSFYSRRLNKFKDHSPLTQDTNCPLTCIRVQAPGSCKKICSARISRSCFHFRSSSWPPPEKSALSRIAARPLGKSRPINLPAPNPPPCLRRHHML
jgi:hypothetical protein